ncbi:unnamed protein product [Miscanthus lutarioriparius]|uniref:Uncharacterized protein n=1 Tax=Miscanthus lutarioriparius TaxID=422564 RepID=A0A811RAI1_9POAL|nr:unnamed protein product [Miscanthus lutarioriparius]
MDQMIELDVLLNVGFNENLRYLYLIMWFMSVVGSYGLLIYHTQDEELAQHQVSMLLFLALACGIAVFGTQVLMPFTGSGNNELISLANTYAQGRNMWYLQSFLVRYGNFQAEVKRQASKSVRKASKLRQGVSAGGEKS